jgi:nanoRNase/pAp phosphatase (c-di-AMP/oligoRNAs hydrolase)
MTQKRSVVAHKPRSLPDQARRLLAQFGPEDRVLIVIVADPDSMASALAFKRLLWRKVASVTIAHTNEISRADNQAMVRLLNIPLEHFSSIKLDNYTKVVMLDSQPHHNEELAQLAPQVIIDHHPVNGYAQKAKFADIRPRYGANSTILTEYLRGARIKPSTRLATALVYGIKNDTAGFQRPCLEDDVEAFQFLFPKANQSVLRKIEFSEMRLKDLDMLRQALDKAVVRKHCMFAYLGEVKNPDNLVQLADFFMKVDNVDSSTVSGIHQDKLIVILRNATLRANAGKLAEQAFGEFGSAGGHKAMARAEIPLTALQQTISELNEKTVSNFIIRRLQGRGGTCKKCINSQPQ